MIKVKPHLSVEQLIISDIVACGDSYHTWAALSYDIINRSWSDHDCEMAALGKSSS